MVAKLDGEGTWDVSEAERREGETERELTLKSLVSGVLIGPVGEDIVEGWF